MDTDEHGKPLAYYVYGIGLISCETARGSSYYHYDMRGSTTLLTDEKGRVTDRYQYGIFGEVEHTEGTTRQPFQYNGRDGVLTDLNGLYDVGNYVCKPTATGNEPGLNKVNCRARRCRWHHVYRASGWR